MHVLLTSGHRNSGLSITRHLGAAGHEIRVADERPLAFGLQSRYTKAFHPIPDRDAPDYADALLALTRRLEPDVLVPHGGVGPICARAAEFERETAVLMPDSEAYDTVADKARLYALCGRLGIPHARVLGTDPETVAARLERNAVDPCGVGGAAHPLAVVKPCRDLGAGLGLVFVRERASLAEVWREQAARHGPMVATEFVPGPIESQLALQLLFGRGGELIEFFVLRKLRQWPPRSGITAEAVSTHDLGAVADVLPLFRALAWRGPAEIELKQDARDGTARVLEINPRFSGTLAFALAAGVDMPGALVRASLGPVAARPLEPYYAAGLRYWNPVPYFKSAVRDLARPSRIGAGLRGLAMPLVRRPAGNPYALRDPAALAGKLLLPLAETLRRRRPSPAGRAARP